MLKSAFAAAWIFWVAWFLAWELSALLGGHSELTLSDYVWRLEEISSGWTFLRYLVAAFCLWLFFHLAFGLFRLGGGRAPPGAPDALSAAEVQRWTRYGRSPKEAGCPVVNVTEDLIWELQDQVQRGNQMLARLCEKAGIDPAEAARLPGEAPSPARAA